jgi:formylglycine-generating enzyme required for sulfatase activity
MLLTAIRLLTLLVLVVVPVAVHAEEVPWIEMVFVKGGCYQRGDIFGGGNKDETPVHNVCVPDYYLGKYEVTQAEWLVVMGKNPSKFKSERRPVDSVSWNDAQEFIARLNAASGRRYRLPTEAEWEYAARSGGKNEKWAGTNDERTLGAYAWYGGNSDDKTHVVGTKLPNALGLYDMSGNVAEWCQDRYGDVYYEERPGDSPSGPQLGERRVRRGGAWNNTPRLVRATLRDSGAPDNRSYDIGLRVALPAR